MGKSAIEGLITVVGLIVGVSIIAVIVSRNSDTTNVIGAGGTALEKIIKAAVSPVAVQDNTMIMHQG